MSLAEQPRRSSRRPKPKRLSAYSVGDVVEITRNGVVARGRLAYELTEGPSPNPRWLVKFSGVSWKDEELYERSFGRTLQKAGEPAAGDPPTKATRKVRGKNTSNDHSNNNNNKSSKKSSNSNHKSSGASSSEDDHNNNHSNGGRKKKSVAFTEDSIMESESSTSPTAVDPNDAAAAKVSAREKRSLRRQAMIHEEEVGSSIEGGQHPMMQGGSAKNNNNNNNNNNNGANKRARKVEEVVKVPLLTGTLYLYRGPHRRAEFVRKL